jgi:hypothetical protein
MARGIFVAIGLALSAAFLAGCASQGGTDPGAYPIYGSPPPGSYCGALGNCVPSRTQPYDMHGNTSGGM